MGTSLNVQETEAQLPEQTRHGRWYRPFCDIVEQADELQLVADMPGVAADALDIRFEDGVLTLHGPVAPRRDENGPYLWREYGVGDFYRTFRVGEEIDGARIQAELADGVLTVHLPKAEAAKPRKIEVHAAK